MPIDPAEQHDRPFDQPGKLGEQGRIVAQAQILRAGHARRRARDLASAFGAVQDGRDAAASFSR